MGLKLMILPLKQRVREREKERHRIEKGEREGWREEERERECARFQRVCSSTSVGCISSRTNSLPLGVSCWSIKSIAASPSRLLLSCPPFSHIIPQRALFHFFHMSHNILPLPYEPRRCCCRYRSRVLLTLVKMQMIEAIKRR